MCRNILILIVICSAIIIGCSTFESNKASSSILSNSNVVFIEDLKYIIYCLNWNKNMITIDVNGKMDSSYPTISLQIVLEEIEIDSRGSQTYYFKYIKENFLIFETVDKPLFLKIRFKEGHMQPLNNSHLTFDFTQNKNLLKARINSLEDSLNLLYSKEPKIFNNWLAEKITANYSSIILDEL